MACVARIFDNVVPYNIADSISKCILLKKNYCILMQISLNFAPNGPINDEPAVVRIRAWHRRGDKSLPEPVMA